jgi:hypothetical protein
VILATAALAAGCDRKFDAPSQRYEVRVEADARSRDACSETVGIRLEPLKLERRAEGDRYATQAFTDSAVIDGDPVMDGPDNWECWFVYQTPALAPGKWLVVGEFSTGSKSCLRDVGPLWPNTVRIDEEEGCR